MPSVVVDSVLVEAGWDPTALERGIAQSERLVQEFAARTVVVAVKLDDTGLSGLHGLTDLQLPPLAVDTTHLRADLDAAAGSVREFLSTIRAPIILDIDPALASVERLNQALQTVLEQGKVAVGLPPLGWDIAPFEAAARAVEERLAQLQATRITLPVPEVAPGAAPSADALKSVSAQFSQSLTEIVASLGTLNNTLAQLNAQVNDFFTGIATEANKGAAAVEQSTTRQVTALKLLSGASPFTQIINDVRQAAADFRAGAISVEDYAQAVRHAEAEMAALRGAGFEPAGRELNAFNVAAGRTTEHTGNATRGLKTMASSMTSLAAQTIGVKSQLGLLAENVLFFGVGGPAVLGIAAFSLAAVAAFEAITRSTQEARKATEDFIKAQAGAARAADPLLAVKEAFAGVDEPGGRKIEGLTARLVRLNAELKDLQKGSEIPIDTGGTVHFVDDAAIAKVKQQIEDLKSAAIQTGSAFLDPILKAQQSATVQAIADTLALTQQGNQALVAALQAAHQQELVSDQAFFARRHQLATDAANADIAALTKQLSAAQITVARNPAEKLAQDETIRHLTSQITLRKAVADQQQIAITNEEKMAGLLLLHEQRLLRIAQAGGGNLVPSAGGALGGNIPTPSLEPSILGPRTQGITVDIPIILRGAVSRETIDIAKLLGDQFEFARQRANVLNRGILDIVRNLASIGGAAGQAIGGVLGLFDALQQVKEANDAIKTATTDAEKATASVGKLGSVLGAVSAGIGLVGSVVGSILGPSEQEQERNRILAENNDLLRRNNAELAVRQGGASVLVGQQAEIQQAIAAFQAVLQQRIAAGSGPITLTALARQGGLPTEASELQRILAAANTSIQEFAAEVKAATGISILDSKSRIVSDAFQQAAKAIDDMIQAATHFSTSISDQQRQAETAFKLHLPGFSADEQVARLQIDRKVELDNLVLDPKLEARIQGLDLSTAAGRQAFLEFQQMLFKMAQSGLLTAEQLGKFANVDELLGPIADAADGLNAFKNATDAAARSIGDFNLPEGFKRAAIAFQTGDVGPDLERLKARTAALENQGFRVTHFEPQLPIKIPVEFTPGIPVVSTKVPEIKPLPDEVQGLLDKIATKTPPDLLSAVGAIANRTPSDLLSAVRVLTLHAPPDLLQAVNQVADLIRATQRPAPDPVGIVTNRPTPSFGFSERGEQRITVTFEGGIHITVQGDRKDARQIGEEVMATLRRKALVQSGDTMQSVFR